MTRHTSSSKFRATTSRSRPVTSMVAIVAMLGLAGPALAEAGATQGTKLVPIARDGHAKKANMIATADGEAGPRNDAALRAPSGRAPLAPPANDECAGAIVIPNGPFPIVTAPVDVSEATPQGSDDPDVCPANGVDQDVWFSFTPSLSGQYVFSTCAGNGATGSTVYDTVLGVFDACPGTATTLVCNDTATSCVADVPGAPYVDQSTGAAVLTGGNTYYIAAGHWSGDVGGIVPGLNHIALKVELSPAPDNDTCSNPTPLPLDRILFGTTASATNDYRSANSCFTGVGQILTSSNGLDVVFSFTPPTTDKYSFRYVQDDSGAALRTQSPALYLSDVCPAPNNTVPVPDCLAGANRMNDQTTGNGNRSEEISCVPLTGGTPYYLFFDDRFGGNPGGPLALEVTRCVAEIEPNDTPAIATVFNPNSGCFMEGSAIASGPAADIDFYDLGAPPAGSKIFVGVDTAASNESDYEMRITNASDTLGYDDNDGTSWVGSNAPIITGVIADGSEIFARVNSKSVIAGNEPYSIFARIETGVAENESGTPDPAPANIPDNGTMYGAGHLTGGGFVKGTIYGWDTTNGPTDDDCFKFIGHEGDNLVAFSDNNPARTPGIITNVWPVLRTIDGNPTPANTRFVGQALRNLSPNTPSAGLNGVTPSVTSEFMHYRLRYTGAYAICYEPTQDTTTENPTPGFYPLPYQGSISLNCGPVGVEPASDPALTQTGPAGPVVTGAIVDYVVTVVNNGPGIAQDVRMVDTLPPEVVYAGATIIDSGAFGGNTECLTVPTPGQNDAPLDCTTYSLVPGQAITYTISVQVQNCSGAGLTVANDASITSYSQDTNTDNNTASWTFTTSENGTCQPTVCDAASCIVNGCAINNRDNPDGTFGHCDPADPGPNGDHCIAQEVNCDDNSLCTADSCDPTNPAHPCVNDSSQQGDMCFDGNDCTADGCDPLTFCTFTPLAPGVACNDFLTCTNNDACDGLGGCVGHSVCDDGLPCTDDFADEANACACDNPLSFPGTICDDGNACTAGTTCDGLGGAVANCNGGAPTSCDDGNACTDDSCDPVLGCVHTNNSGACDDGDACTAGDTCSGGVCNAGAPIVCDDGNVCTTDSCSPATGCVFTNSAACGDANPCTDDSCDPVLGCVHTNNTAACDDGDACTTGDACGGGVCTAGAPTVCNDGNVCTTDSCSPATGCVFTNNTAACDDGNACTSADVCGGGACSGTAIVCNDGNACTTDSCSPATGCVFTDNTAACDDANPCTDDSCDPVLGCVHTNNTAACDDGDACTTGDTCGGGVCTAGAPTVCNDGNVCTTDSCSPATGCVFTNNTAACDDGNACTSGDVCGGGTCAGVAIVCTDGNACTTDSCSPATGCVFTNNTAACDDGDACTTGDTCGGGVCNGGAPTVCTDGNVCTTDSCSPATGCVFTNNTVACDDGNACTAGDVCGGGVCAGVAIVCNDANACTDDSCNPASGCVFAPNTAPCNDGNACTQTDTCSGGACVGSNPVVCTALDSCHTAGTCTTGTGTCSNPQKASGAACDDANACTTNDACDNNGACIGGAAPNCDDGNACTADDCDPATGCAHGLANFDAGGFSASRVDGRDLAVLAATWNLCPGSPGYDAAADLDHVACVDLTDFHLFMTTFGLGCP